MFPFQNESIVSICWSSTCISSPWPPGKPGRDGIPGNPGKSGKDGIPGNPGKAGKDGSAGNPGLNGRDGRDGQQGTQGNVIHIFKETAC